MKIVLFSSTGYVGGMLKEFIQGKKNVQLLGLTRKNKLDEYYGDYDILIYSASVSRADAEKYIKDNVLTAIKMMDFSKRHHIKRIIYLSSDSIYGGINTEEVSENAVMVAPDFYGTTKYLAERIIMESGIPYYILRMPGIVGKVWRNTYLYRLMDSLCRHETVTVYNGEKNFNNVLDIDDLIQFIMLLCSLKKENSEIFLLGNTEKIELSKIVSYVKGLCQSASEINFISTKDKRYFTLNVDKAVTYGYSSKSIWDIIDGLYKIKNIGGQT